MDPTDSNPDAVAKVRGIYIKKEDVEAFGFTPGCKRCRSALTYGTAHSSDLDEHAGGVLCVHAQIHVCGLCVMYPTESRLKCVCVCVCGLWIYYVGPGGSWRKFAIEF